jgi:hypothetical protein
VGSSWTVAVNVDLALLSTVWSLSHPLTQRMVNCPTLLASASRAFGLHCCQMRCARYELAPLRCVQVQYTESVACRTRCRAVSYSRTRFSGCALCCFGIPDSRLLLCCHAGGAVSST